MVFGHGGCNGIEEGRELARGDSCFEFVNERFDGGGRKCNGVIRTTEVFSELFARAKADVLDCEVGFIREGFSEVGDAGGGADFWNEDVARAGRVGDGEDGRNGVAERDEVAASVRMSDGKGLVMRDLILEDGNDAAGGTEDVAEADGIHALADSEQFGDAFGDAHDAVGVGGFVGGDKEKVAIAVANGLLQEDVGSEDVGLGGGERIGFQELDVFVGSGVEDLLRMELVKEVMKKPCVVDGAEDKVSLGGLGEEGAELEEVLFGGIEEEQSFGLLRGDGEG